VLVCARANLRCCLALRWPRIPLVDIYVLLEYSHVIGYHLPRVLSGVPGQRTQTGVWQRLVSRLHERNPGGRLKGTRRRDSRLFCCRLM
jgi:hypothetical protein